MNKKSSKQIKADRSTQYESIFHNNHTVMLVIEPGTGVIVDANQAACNFYQYPKEELIGKNIGQINILPMEEIKAEMERARSEARSFFNFRHRLANGEIKDVEVYSGPIVSNDGRQLLYSVIHDSTQRIKAEASVHQKTLELNSFFDVSVDLMVIASMDGYFLRLNNAWEKLLGYPVEEIQRSQFFDFIHPDDIEKTKNVMTELINQKPIEGFENRYRCKDGSYRWIEWHAAPMGGMIFSSARDITDKKKSEIILEEANKKLTLLVADLEKRNHDASVLRDMDEMLLSCSNMEEAYAVMDKFAPLVFQGTDGAIYLVERNPKQVKKVSAWGDQLNSEAVFGFDECWGLRLKKAHQWNKSNNNLPCKHVNSDYTGQYIDLPLVAAGDVLGLIHLEWHNNQDGVPGGMELMHNVMEQLTLTIANIKLRQELIALSIRDHLTGLVNRRFMEEYLQKELLRANRNHTHAGIVFLDIDNFKLYNDTYGHKGGDAVLKGIGSLLLKKVRGGDIASRIGGEEFIVIFPETDLETTFRRAEQISEAIRSMQVDLNGNPLGKVTVSAGIAAYPDHGIDIDSLLDFADRGLYKAKRNGRDRIEIADEV